LAQEVNNKPKIKTLFMRRQSANFIIKDIETDKNYVFENNSNNPWVEGELLTISVENTRRSGKHKVFLKGIVVDSTIDIRALDITSLTVLCKLHTVVCIRNTVGDQDETINKKQSRIIEIVSYQP